MSEIIPDLLELLHKHKLGATDEQLDRIAKKVAELGSYQPRVAIFGKTGSGKSSLCNAIFGDDVAPVSDIEACTRSPQEYLLQLSPDKAIVLLDVPGVGESSHKDDEYVPLYKSLLPNVDLLLWVVRCDDRAMTIDLHVWNDLVKKHVSKGAPAFIVLNQIDRVNPVREWDTAQRQPGPNQSKTIAGRMDVVARDFSLSRSDIVPVSAVEGYGITELVEQIVHRLPNEKKLPFLSAVREERQSETAKKEAKEGFIEAVGTWVRKTFKAVEPYIPTIVSVLRIIFGK
jgi:small GTP-binding protein